MSGLGRGKWRCLSARSADVARGEANPHETARACWMPRSPLPSTLASRSKRSRLPRTLRAVREMDRKRCLELIQFYSENRALWDSTWLDYTNREKRNEIWSKISLEMDLPTKKLKKKMVSLLGAHRRELSREKQSRLSISGMHSPARFNYVKLMLY